MATQVKIRNKATKGLGSVLVRTLPFWEARGYEAVDPDEVKAAREADGITTEDVKTAEKVVDEGTAASSAENTDGGKTTRGGRTSA